MSDSDKQALIDGSATIETKLLIYNENGIVEQTLTQENSVKSWDYIDDRIVEKQGFIGQFKARELNGELQNVSDTFSIENKTIEVYLGVRRFISGIFDIGTEDDENVVSTETGYALTLEGIYEKYITHFYSLGKFIVSSPTDDEVKDNTSFESTDYTILFDIPFDSDFTDTEYTSSFNQKLKDDGYVTLSWLASYTCKQAGVSLGSTDFRNNNYQITENQFVDGDECRDVMKEIGKLAISWVRVDWDNKVYIDFGVKTSIRDNFDKITYNEYYSLETQNETYGPINKASLGSSVVTGDNEFVKDDESISKYGLKELAIYDSIIANSQDRRKNAIQVGTQVFGFKYKPLETETIGHPWLKPTDLIEVDDMENTPYLTYPFKLEINYNGHIKTTITAEAQTDTEQTYSYGGSDTSSTSKQQTKIDLDRANQEIKAVVSRVTDTESSITDINVELGSISSRVSNTETITSDLEDTLSYFNVDMDTYSMVIPVDYNYKPYLTTQYPINYYGYFKGKQIVPDVNTSSTVTGITLSFSTTQITVNVNKDTVIPNLTNSFLINFIYTVDSKTYALSKQLNITLSVQGKNGVDGTSVTILGSYDTLEELKAAHPTGSPGDAYMVQGDLYVWSETLNDWQNVGQIKGDKGDDGEDGTSAYVYVRYSENSDGNPMTVAPTSTTKYIGVVSTTSPTSPTSYTSYTWSLIKGTDGIDGTDSYLHIMYSEDGTTFTPAEGDYTLGKKPSAWIGTYVDSTEQDSAEFDDYKWYKFTENIDGTLTSMQNDISNNKTNISNNYTELVNSLSNYATKETVLTIEKSVETLQTNSKVALNFIQDIQVNGVSQVKTSKGFTFDDSGLTIEATNAPTSSNLDTDGLTIIDKTGSSNETLLEAKYDEEIGETVVKSKNMIVQKYLTVGTNSRFEDYEDGTACFYIGG